MKNDIPGNDGLLPITKRLAGLFQPDGNWRHDISPTYGRLIHQWEGTERQLQVTLRDTVKRFAGILNESMVFERNQRLVLAVKQDFRGRIKGILQDYSASGHTAYIEPQATVPLQNKLAQIEAELEEELWRIRCEVTAEILDVGEIETAIRPRIAYMDMMQALAASVKPLRLQALCPNQERGLDLLGARHPFLDEHFAESRQYVFETASPDRNHMVAFQLSLDDSIRGMIVSGANTGGKTVTLKTTGLLSWMANSGLPVPVDEGSRIPYYSAIVADIGDNQSLSHNLSTFASHLANLRHILEGSGRDILVLLDELGSGTDPREGSALAQAMIEEMVARGYHLLITTHHQILCTMALNHPNLENGSMIFDPRLLRPTYRFQQGVPGRSHALEIAREAGLPEPVLARAHELIDEEQVDIQAAIQQLQRQHKELQKQKQKLRKDELRLHRRIQQAKKESQELEREKDTFKDKAKLRLTKIVDKAERDVRDLMTDLNSQRQKRSVFNKFKATKNDLMEPFEQPKKLHDLDVKTTGLGPDQWQAGDKVFLKTWLKEGTLLGMDRKRARIDLNGKQLTVDIGDVLHLEQPKQNQKTSRVMDHVEDSGGTVPVEIRLLGFTVEDALMEIDQVIDRALRQGNPFLRIIHGHGTGRLKTAIRDHLRTHPAKTAFRSERDQENDGVTEIHFTD